MWYRGVIRLFVDHPKAANLLMVATLVAGAVVLNFLPVQLWPSYDPQAIDVRVEWPGAAPVDIDRQINVPLEAAVRQLNDLKSLNSFANSGAGTLSLRFEDGADMQIALSEVEAAVSRTTFLPDDSRPPRVSRRLPYERVVRILIAGPIPERAINRIARQLQDDLRVAGVTQTTLQGVKRDELRVDVPLETLRRLSTSIDRLAVQVRQGLGDAPGGEAASGDIGSGETSSEKPVQTRTRGAVENVTGLQQLPIATGRNGASVTLAQIATVEQRFANRAVEVTHPQGHAAILRVFRAEAEDALEVYRTVAAEVSRLQARLPETVTVTMYDVQAERLSSRIRLLFTNGMTGLMILLAILYVFLNGRVAFWVAMGIPTAFMATFVVLLAIGASINMVTLFAFVMVIGIIVDDAIVVVEHITVLHAAGTPAATAAKKGAIRMSGPVVASTLTTVAAFLPILMVTDVLGSFVAVLPVVICAALLASLIECFLILPGHLRSALNAKHTSARAGPRWRRRFQEGFENFTKGRFKRIVTAAIANRYLTLLAAAVFVFLSVSLLTGGVVPFRFWLSPEPNVIYANITMAKGASRTETAAAQQALWRALPESYAELGLDPDLTVGTIGIVGRHFGRSSPPDADNLAGIYLEVVDSDQRDIDIRTIAKTWHRQIDAVPGMESLSISPRLTGPPGRDIDIQLTGDDPLILKRAAIAAAGELHEFVGVSEISDSFPFSGRELVFTVNETGEALGLTAKAVGQYVRNALDGIEIKQVTVDDEVVRIIMAVPPADRRIEALDRHYLPLEDGTPVPLLSVADPQFNEALPAFRRSDGAVSVHVYATTDYVNADPTAVLSTFRQVTMPQLEATYGVGADYKGRHEEQTRAFREIFLASIVGVVGIYVVLIWTFRSYVRPLTIIAVVPCGVAGAILGHGLMGFPVTMNSVAAMVGLGGILVNDAIVLVAAFDARRRETGDYSEAAVAAAQDRLRAVLLTSLTTTAGLLPLLFETSYQAQFLIPIAATVVFGLAFATVIVLVLVPCALRVEQDIILTAKRLFAPRRAGNV